MTAARTKGAVAEHLGTDVLTVGAGPVGIDDVLALARGERQVALSTDPAYRSLLARSREAIERSAAEGRPVYGVTTGVGRSVDNEIPTHLRDEMPHNLFRFHGCGVGRILDEVEAAAVLAVRLVSLAAGASGVRVELLERLCELLNARILPLIPAQGSVGASGDLTPLSYLAAAVAGEREVTFNGRVMEAADALAALEPFVLVPKESLALMNGTSVMTALACLALERADRLARLASAVTAIVSDSIHGNPGHFDARIFDLKPHPGQKTSAAWIRASLADCGHGVPGGRDARGLSEIVNALGTRGAAAAHDGIGAGSGRDVAGDPDARHDRVAARLQDRYSVRCAPHVIGVLVEAVANGRRTVEIELNGADDNPLVDPASGDVLHGGNFYGGHVCFVMDGLKTAVASMADLLDRQLTLLCCPETSDGLPANLVANGGEANVTHHGFKAMQITASALVAEASKLTMPASAFSRSTESHNQDKVSMGTIAARDCLEVLTMSETVAAIVLLAGCQAADLREREGDACVAAKLRTVVREHVAMVTADRRQDTDIERVLELLHGGELAIDTLEPA
jgi:histidine ammonia-lyase